MFKKNSCLLLAAMFTFCTLVSSEVKAKDFAWQGTQIQLASVGTLNLNESGSVQLRGQFTGFFVPSSDVVMAFLYVGPVFNIHEAFWVAPQLGSAHGWFPKGQDAADFSVWLGGTLANGWFSYFVESDLITEFSTVEYYGYYAVDLNTQRLPFNHGLQGEQANGGIMFGPHTGYTIAGQNMSLHLELQYYVGVQDDNFGHAVRAFLAISGNK